MSRDAQAPDGLPEAPGYDEVRRTLVLYSAALIGGSLLLGLLHVLFADVRIGGTRWFDMDKERNLATWFSGVLFFLFGCSALAAWYWEQKRNAGEPGTFKLPVLWLGVAAAGLYMSLDEITILHENLFWREVRIASSERSDAWKFLTQWQIVFAPAILLGTGYFLLFFSNRFGASKQALKSAFTGVGCWVTALLLEAVRGTFKSVGGSWYGRQVVVEELLEMMGAIFLLGAIVSYVLDIALDFDPQRRKKLGQATRWLNRRAVTALAIGMGALVITAGTAYVLAGRQAAAGDSVPGLFRKALAERPQTRPRRAGDRVWFEDVARTSAPSESEAVAAASYAASILFGQGQPTAEAVLTDDREPRLVFLATSDGQAQASVVNGSGVGLQKALDDAIERVANKKAVRWARLDLVSGVEAEERVSFRPPLEMERGIHGLTFNREAGIALVPDELTGNDLVTKSLAIQPRSTLAYLTANRPDEAAMFRSLLKPGVPVPYRFFTTTSFFMDGTDIVPLFRGHRIYDAVDSSQLLAAARAAGEYLVRAVRDDGEFHYSYLPDRDSFDDTYNMLRHAGTIYSMMELYEVTQDGDLLAAGERALRYMVDSFRPCPGGGKDTICTNDSGAVKLGGNALAVIALIKHLEVTGDTQYRRYLMPLVGWMLSVQNAKGEFTIHKQMLADGTIDEFVSAYYPGEAILALSRAYDLEKDPRLLTGASNAARWLIDVRDRGKTIDELNHDHWLLYALNDLYRQKRDPAFVEHARRITEAIVTSQNRQPEVRDWLGSYYKPPRSTPTAIRTEGLAASLALARDHGDASTVPGIRAAIELGVRFDLQTQFGPEKAMFFPDPGGAMGGFSKSLTDPEIRIDYVQHNISALLALIRILEAPG